MFSGVSSSAFINSCLFYKLKHLGIIECVTKYTKDHPYVKLIPFRLSLLADVYQVSYLVKGYNGVYLFMSAKSVKNELILIS
jgi:hypothetical protein